MLIIMCRIVHARQIYMYVHVYVHICKGVDVCVYVCTATYNVTSLILERTMNL